VKFAFVHDHRDAWPVSVMCRVLGVTAAGYYAHRKRPPSARAVRRETLADAVRTTFVECRQVYGSPRVTRVLHARGVRCSENTVAKLLKAMALSAVRRRRKRPPPSPALAAADPPHVLNREFTTAAPNTQWTSDITDLGTRAGWVYLAVMVDLFSRRVVGWAMSRSPDTELVGRPLRSAVTRRRPPAGVLVHSDRGCQYTSADYRAVLASAEVVFSFSRKGNCWGNAPPESLVASLKKELWHRRSFADAGEAERAVFEYLGVFYNRERLHSSLGYVRPATFESQQPTHTVNK
jgi:transposase InsO family protein